jgi:CRISPR-associated helicase Cas3/CRISPR-associated endonuclease Cas3-HD
MSVPFYAHSGNAAGEWELLDKHLRAVAALAADFGAQFGEAERAYIAGLLHDVGKYGDLFQRRLLNQESGIDHWSAGAWVSLDRYKNAGIPLALAIEGHHTGLRQWSKSAFQKLNPKTLRPPEAPRLSERDLGILLCRLTEDGVLPAPEIHEALPPPVDAIAKMLEVRMLFSALADADFLATEEHFDQDRSRLRQAAERLEALKLISLLKEHLERIRASSPATAAVKRLREDLLSACLDSARRTPGLYTLTAPTGSGKTLALLMFALEHARVHQQRRIVVVLPFLSIIDQTVSVYRDAVANGVEEYAARKLVLEDHSLTETSQADETAVDVTSARQRALLAENWDAPVIVTTSVQFLESLFSNSPAACRKLHRLANSVVIFDEVQTLPLRIAIPTLAALSHLSHRYRTTVVFSTATQPAFDHLDMQVKKLCVTGWRPEEIVPPLLNLYARASRVSVTWPSQDERTSFDDLAGPLSALDQALCIVNVKRHARDLFLMLERSRGDHLFHLSTYMCPAHRKAVLGEIRERLAAEQPCLVVATQCVEAGVDLDFPVVYRALAPLDAIAQAAGRCNRNGRLSKGNLRVFHPADARYPSSDYKQAAALTAEMLAHARGNLSLDDPDVFRKYYQRLYSLASIDAQKPDLREAVQALDFVEVRRLYRVIENADSINVLTAYDPARYEELAAQVRRDGLTWRWVAQARALTVSLFRPRAAHRIYDFLEPVRLRNRSPAPDWLIHLRPEHYHSKLGLEVPQEMEFMSV